MFRTVLAIALTLGVVGAYANEDISHVNGSITATTGQHYGDLSTVNGSIRVEQGAQAGELDTVNGSVTLGEKVQITSVNTVNGSIKAGRHTKIKGDANTVNGSVRLGFNSSVGGDVGTANGSILVQQTDVAGRVHTANGDITIGALSHVHGGIRVEKPTRTFFGIHWGNKPKTPRIVIGPNATVDGELRFDREVELFVHTTAKIGKVIGSSPKAYTDTLPARL